MRNYTEEQAFDDCESVMPRSMQKWQLAKLYFPDYTRHSAVNRLMNWVTNNRNLTEELKSNGYSKEKRLFSAEQVRLIFKHLGLP